MYYVGWSAVDSHDYIITYSVTEISFLFQHIDVYVVWWKHLSGSLRTSNSVHTRGSPVEALQKILFWKTARYQ